MGTGLVTLRLGSLCSGAGMLDLAVAQVLDVTTAWHCENDAHAARVLAHHWPDVPNHGDLTAVDWSTVEPVDVVTAGFPCQPISQAGRRKVTNDARWLWPHIAHAVRVLRPRLVLLENVVPLLRPWRDDDTGLWYRAPIEEVAADLASLRYDLRWTCLRAADIGAPHRRERVFIVGVASNADDIGRQGGQPWALGHTGRAHRPTPHTSSAGTGRDGRAVQGTAPGARRPGIDVHAAVDDRSAAPHPGSEGRSRAGHTEPGDRSSTDVRRGPTQPGGRGSSPADAAGERRPRRPCRVPGGRNEAERVEAVDIASNGAHAWGVYEPAIRRWERILDRTPPPHPPTKPAA